MSIKSSLIEFSPSRGICFILALAMIVWGVWVFLPFTAFNGPTYALMASVATEYVWGGFMLFGGVTLLAGVMMRNVEWIRSGAFLGFVIWVILAILGSISDPTGVGFSVRGALALMHAYMYMQVKIHEDLITGDISITDLRDYVKHRRSRNDTAS